uniref:Radial spoke head component 4A n=1 Tax=Denticeps clupeoides TaxID=299321 RepID=A0AAY4EN24_9TELE
VSLRRTLNPDYEHLVRLLSRVREEQPQDPVDVLEEMSRELKRGALQQDRGALRDVPATTPGQWLAEQQRALFSRARDEDEDDLVETPLPNLAEVAFFFQQAGVGLGGEEMQKVSLALRQLSDARPLRSCRFWGKVLGTEANYLVAECREAEPPGGAGGEGPGEGGDEDIVPPSTYKAPPVVPAEERGTGTNSSAYFVCREPGLPWTRLPDVVPAHITAARRIRKFFTGRLDAPVTSYPPFPGAEAEYLRAQIARISSGTQVSPLGFYHLQEEDEEEDEEQGTTRGRVEENPDFEPLPVTAMSNSLSAWVHHVPHILTQGRCVWVNPAEKPVAEPDEDEEEEEEPDEPEREEGPALFTQIDRLPPWSSRLSSALVPRFAVAYVRSNLWPGAHAYARGRKFQNVYIGWGVKSDAAFSPALPPDPQREFPGGPEVTEEADPTPQEERALRAAAEDKDETEDETEEDEDTE